jgi:hypothetical protein
MAPSRRRILLLSLVLVVVAWLVADVLSGGRAGLLSAAPTLLLCASLLAGRYVGEERLLALAHGRVARPRRRRVRVSAPRTRMRVMARGGRLVARSLAKRPPPRSAAVLIA